MKADECKIWTLIYSMFCWRNILREIWYFRGFFVKASMMLCKLSTTIPNTYGSDNCVPNMLLMLHLKECTPCIRDFGSVYVFWCCSFQQYNGTMGNHPCNNHSIEIRVMRKFITSCIMLKFVPKKSTTSQ